MTAGAGPIASAVQAFIVWVGVEFDVAARAIRSLAFRRSRAGLAGVRACSIATNAVNAMGGVALRRHCAAFTESEERERACSRAVAIAIRAFIVGVGACDDDVANTVRSLAFLGCRTAIAEPRANIVAANVIDAKTRRALGGRGAQIAIWKQGTRKGAIAFAEQAFVIGIGSGDDCATRSIGALTFLRGRTRLACFRARGIATDAICTIARGALRIRIACGTVRCEHRAHARSVAITARAFVVGVRVYGDEPARTIGAGTFLGCRTSITGSSAMIVAAEPVDAICGQTVRIRCARQAVVVGARATATAPAAIALVVGIRVVFDVATRSI